MKPKAGSVQTNFVRYISHYRWFETRICINAIAFERFFEYTIRGIQGNQDEMKLNGAHQLLLYADKFNILGEILHNIKKNADSGVFSLKENGVNDNKTKYMIISRDQNDGRNRSIENSSF